MPADVAQSRKLDDRTKVDRDHSRSTSPHAPGLKFVEAEKSTDDPFGHYVPGKWSWRPARSSYDW